MKKLLFSLSLLLFSITSFAQLPGGALTATPNTVDSSWSIYALNSPTSTYGNRFNVFHIDKRNKTLYIRLRNFNLDSVALGRADATPAFIAGFDANGVLKLTNKNDFNINLSQLTNNAGFITGSYTGFDSRYILKSDSVPSGLYVTKTAFNTALADKVSSVGLSSTDLTVSNSPITSSGNITANLTTTGVTSGTYRGAYTVDSKGRLTSAINPSVNNNVNRSISNAAGSTNQFTISATQPAFVTYSITMNFTVTALVSSSATIFLEYSIDGGTNWITVSQAATSFNLGLSLSGSNDMSLSGYLPANVLVRLRPSTSNASVSFARGQEVLY